MPRSRWIPSMLAIGLLLMVISSAGWRSEVAFKRPTLTAF
jgi:hypothetical protein